MKSPEFDHNSLYFIPLGGSEQFGVNFNVYISGGQYLAIDCGIGFADERFPGIDLLLPDPDFLEKNRDNLQALIVTHAHEDHVGAVAHLWRRLKCPVYTTPFAAAVLHRKLDEAKLKDVPVHIVQPEEIVDLGNFKAQFVPVAHSIPDTSALIIDTPQGKIVHSGDWNMDPEPVVGYKTESRLFKQAAKDGVLAYVGDSTNSEIDGRAGSESEVAKGLEAEFKKCKGKIAVTMFASNIGRIVSIAKAAQKCGRDVGIIGRSLHRMISAARECGFLDGVPEFVNENDLGYLPNDKVVVIVTGSQGESRAALARIARGEYRGFSLGKGDSVIFSARPIPGNDININHVKNNLSAGGVNIVTSGDTQNIIHVSGHPCRDEVADMFQWLRPNLVIPVHGERVQLDAHAAIARNCQVPNVIVPCNGSVIKIAPGAPEIVNHIETGLLAVDHKRLIPSTHSSISARRKLQYTGAMHLSVAMDIRGEMLGNPRLNTIGLIDPEAAGEKQIENNLYNEIIKLMDDMTKEERMDDHFVSEELRIGMRRFCFYALGFKPKTTVHVIRI